MSDLFCLHCGVDQTDGEMIDGECSACSVFGIQRSSETLSGEATDPSDCVHCGCYFHQGEDCCGCGANLNNASR